VTNNSLARRWKDENGGDEKVNGRRLKSD